MNRAMLVALVVAAVGCDQQHSDPTPSPAPVPPPATVAADNTRMNERERTADTLTPLDQGTSEADRTITQQIRKGVIDQSSLSMNGKNVKVITRDGVVTLRGPVKNDQERAAIVGIAKRIENVKRVDDQLDIASN